MQDESIILLAPAGSDDDDVQTLLTRVGFDDWESARQRLLAIAGQGDRRDALADSLPMLLAALSAVATPDSSLLNFERFAGAVPDVTHFFRFLARHPRAVEILVKIFVGSQFLTEILLRNPTYLERLTEHRQLAELKSREQFVDEGRAATDQFDELESKLDALRRFQRWELLRIGACDTFQLMDLRTATVQLSLLADAIVRIALALHADELDISTDGFAVLAFGKLGGEELNYSSDIDLVFVAGTDATRFWPLGQNLIKTLINSTSEGFLYRTDMRLRPWGRSGPLVTSIDAHIDYLAKHGMLWEKQALVKARVIAGDEAVGRELLSRAEPFICANSADQVRESIREMKGRIEEGLRKKGRKFGEVKSGQGSIRDIEFTVQYLQLAHGGDNPDIRTFNTMNALIGLADFGFIQADEYRQLTSGYVFLRTIEHSLQLMHHKQAHALPTSERELLYLARRLDFPDAEQFVTHYRQHSDSIRAIYEKYIEGEIVDDVSPERSKRLQHEHIARMEPSYHKTFADAEITRHADLLGRLSERNVVEVDAQEIDDGRWEVTVVGYDSQGDLPLICGLLFVYGFNIQDGNAFIVDPVSGLPSSIKNRGRRPRALSLARKFVDVFAVEPPLEVVLPEVWKRYREDLVGLIELSMQGNSREAQGKLAKRVAGALRAEPEPTEPNTNLYPVDIEIDNNDSPHTTVLHIRAEDTIGFLYELANGLALCGVDVVRMIVSSVGNHVFDTLYVTDENGQQLTDPDRQHQLRTAIVLIKHFTHLLPRSPNPEAALLHFRDFLEQLFSQDNWHERVASIERTSVLDALARLLGVSNFLWEDFLRLQHDNLFPVVRDVEQLEQPRPREMLESELHDAIAGTSDRHAKRAALNDFKDREMFRADMRHILGHVTEFGSFSAELTNVAEVVVSGACRMCYEELEARFGRPMRPDGTVCPVAVVALGKCGGRELGFASDIELMFVYEQSGSTTGPESITSTEFFLKLVENFTKSIRAKSEGIFQIDLRLRPYGKGGSLAVSLEAFRNYFSENGAAWPYERQALVKLRTIAGDEEFGRRIEQLRDELIYTDAPFDVTSMRAMREKQNTQLVKVGSLNAKLSPGGLVDTEYLIQGLQITHGGRLPQLRATNTRRAMSALRDVGVLPSDVHDRLQAAYIFQRQLIDALRMVSGNAKDLTVSPPDSEEFEFLARRLGYADDLARLREDLESHASYVYEQNRLLDEPLTSSQG